MKRTRLKPRSQTRIMETEQRAACVELVLSRDRWVCQAHPFWPDVPCEGPLASHEVVQRSVRPGSHLEPDLQVCICRVHHDLVHLHVGYSHEVGMLRKSWEVDDSGQLKPLAGAA